ncbi:MAG: threonine synthase [Phycisphaerae bacterium]|nr:threonine synthase [Phycisphaerae bacterium]NUQ45780.1 threonine synthase [Phycisphaerae bacterium]
MTSSWRLTCIACGRPAEPPASAGTCPSCGDPFAILDVQFDLDRAAATMTRDALARRSLNHWRYAELLPVEPDPAARTWPVGWTPILDAPRLAFWAGCGTLRLKDEGCNPTASFKDRASSVGVVHALARGATRIACASTGNAASSLAGYAAMAGLPATIFVPWRAPEPKLTQLLIYGADVRRVRGTYAQAYELCSAECTRHGWYNRNCAINPYLVEGKKTCGLEIAEQTAADAPDWVVVSVGDGCTIAGIAKGLIEMHKIGFLSRVPRVLGVQAAGVDPVARAFEAGELPRDCSGQTIADSIDVPVPRNWRKAVHYVRATHGTFVRASDDEIRDAMKSAGRLAGIFAEPAAAAAIAGVRRAVTQQVIERDASVLAVVTGSGLKDIRTAMTIAGAPTEVEPLGACTST